MKLGLKAVSILVITTLLSWLHSSPVFGMNPPMITTTYPIMKDSFGSKVVIANVNQQIVMTTSVVNVLGYDTSTTTIVEARDSKGTTWALGFQTNMIKDFGRAEVGISWIPETAGIYELRTFVITNFTTLEILSVPVSSTIRIETFSPPDNVWVAMNTSQCAEIWDLDYSNRLYSLERGETIIEHFFKEQGIQVFKTREIQYVTQEVLEELAHCDSCACSSGKTLYIEVSNSNAAKMKEFGFIEKSSEYISSLSNQS